ncbi:unnamed protein product [marine sediment metagenome]|uniref:Uncharacterized protein n=1 Tax=marine sediment metagenome TaxID=412755 RepID=X0V0W7_9ZZZZ
MEQKESGEVTAEFKVVDSMGKGNICHTKTLDGGQDALQRDIRSGRRPNL